MSHVKIKLKEDSAKDYLTTPNGIVVTKGDYTIVDDTNLHAQYLINREDVILEDVEEDVVEENVVIKDGVDEGTNEGSVAGSITDNNITEDND